MSSDDERALAIRLKAIKVQLQGVRNSANGFVQRLQAFQCNGEAVSFFVLREFKNLVKNLRKILGEIDPNTLWEEDRRRVEGALPLEQKVMHPSPERLSQLIESVEKQVEKNGGTLTEAEKEQRLNAARNYIPVLMRTKLLPAVEEMEREVDDVVRQEEAKIPASIGRQVDEATLKEASSTLKRKAKVINEAVDEAHSVCLDVRAEMENDEKRIMLALQQ